MPDTSLARSAGAIAVAAGVALALIDAGRWALARPDDRLGMMADPLFRVFNGAYFAAFVGLAIALVALHARLGPRLGRFGLLAFLVALIGTMTQGGNMWFDGFAAPWLAEVAPQVFTAPPTITLEIGALAAYLLFSGGWVLFGIALLRARAAPVATAVAVILGGVLGYHSGLSPYGIPLGLAVAALGVELARQPAQPRRNASTASTRRLSSAPGCSPSLPNSEET